jgi:type I restriction enzyme, R subunit
VDGLQSEEDQAKFVIAFRKLLRSMNVLQSYADFDWEDLAIDIEEYKGYETKFLDLKDIVKQNQQKQKVSILNDIDFELELIHRDQINVAYIIKLLAQLKGANSTEAKAQRKTILDLLGGDIQLRSKRELIQKFIDENLPLINDVDAIDDEFEKFWQDQKVLALGKLCEEEHLDKAQFKALIDAYIYSGREPIKDEVFQCLDNRPSILQARTIGDRIIAKMKEFLETFVEGMVA